MKQDDDTYGLRKINKVLSGSALIENGPYILELLDYETAKCRACGELIKDHTIDKLKNSCILKVQLTG